MNAYSGKHDLTFAEPSLSRVAPRHNAPGLLARIGDAVRAVAQLPRRYAVMNELYTMSDRELDDIGLTRGEVRHVFDARYTGRF